MADTARFIRDLPPDLVAAFRGTLVDASDARYREKMEAIEGILRALSVDGLPRLVVFNEIDRLPAFREQVFKDRPDELVERIGATIQPSFQEVPQVNADRSFTAG